jgi:hypothetical protein
MTTTRGRYAATRNPLPRRLLAVTAALAFLATLGLAGASAARADTTAVAGVQAEYGGERWPTNTKPICFTTNTISDRRWVDTVNAAAKAWDAGTANLKVIARPDCKASGYTEYVKVYAKNYGRTPWKACGETKNWRGCGLQGVRYWRQVPSDGPWTVNGWTWVYGYNQGIRLNSYYGVSMHTTLHEMGHLLGLAHPNRYTTYAVMATTSTTTSPGRLTFWDMKGWIGSNKPGVDAIYWKG